jgi:flavin-dependent dehydrogenase
LQELGVWDGFLALHPARTHRCFLHFGAHHKQWKLAEAAFGLSRLQLDRLLLNRATSLGADVICGVYMHPPEPQEGTAVVAATGRPGNAIKPGRLFAFKSHFDGPAGDAVEVYFKRWGYIGISGVENGVTNVCGISTEDVLRKFNFQFDDFIAGQSTVAERLRPLTRRMPWLTTGPLVFSQAGAGRGSNLYPAGDAFGFVDPFTGSGILNALLTGRMAGAAAARGIPAQVYRRECRALLRRPFVVSALFRTLLRWGCAGYLAGFVPGNWMYRLTRGGVAG